MKRGLSKYSNVRATMAAGCAATVIFSAGLALRAQQPAGSAAPKAAAASSPAAVAKLEVPESIVKYAAPEQPLPFSHKGHIARGLQCARCHTNPDPGNQMTFPAVAPCMGCHRTIAKDKPAIQKLTDFAKSADPQPIPWVRVYRVTAGVTWTHRKHLQAGLQCANCHGNVPQVEQMSQTTAVTAMASCIRCHQARNVASTCQTCHAWPAGDNIARSGQ